MTVVLVDPRRPSLVPVEAIILLAGDVQYTEEMPVKVPWSLPASRPAYTGEDAPVLLSSDPDHPMVKSRLAAGARLITAPAPQSGERLVDAVAIMDTLRTSGPWEREQTHESLRRYLLEETYELFDAVRGGNADEVREELGDVLLQVLFHARIAEDGSDRPFGIDDVADALVRKLGNRAPAVLAGEAISLDEQLAQWEDRKALESSVKARRSCVDDVPTAQPALALTQKVFERVTAVGLPEDLIPEGLVTIGVRHGGDAENVLRTLTLDFMDTVRSVEQSIVARRRGAHVPEELGSSTLGAVTEEEWRAHWPTLELPLEDDPPASSVLSDREDDHDPDLTAPSTEPEAEPEPEPEPDDEAQDSSVEPQ